MSPALVSALIGLAIAFLARGPRIALSDGARRGLGIALLFGAGGAVILRLFPLAAALAAVGAVMLARRRRGRKPKVSTVRTAALEMVLDHESGEMDGMVLTGRFEDRRLSDMSLEDLLALAAGLQEGDEESSALLASYLDRVHPDWRERAGEAAAAPEGPMTRAQARALLGLGEDADAEAVRAAHRRLMKRVHPDHGGSAALAAQITTARDVLLAAL